MATQTCYENHVRSFPVIICTAILLLGLPRPAAADAEPLKSYNVKLDETSVSGISSGAFMAVQVGVAHSSIIKGVGATAGGPYFCASDTVPSLRGSIGNVIARCMQGDPDYPKRAITKAQLDTMVTATKKWSRAGRIDATSNLETQKIWLFHGYNDGVVKFPVTGALYDYYTRLIDPSRIFYKDNLKAGHAQITDDCGEGQSVCNLCEQTGGKFLNQCRAGSGSNAPYDAVGSLLQHIYGNLRPKNGTGAPAGKIVRFSQSEFALDSTGRAAPIRIGMADEGYMYVPDACDRGEPCRVHVAFHGCLQSAQNIGNAFYEHAGYNEWADSNHFILLYPQTQPTSVPVVLPMNPQGCWDWWGYNDRPFDTAGRYVTKQGLQLAAIRRMLDRLAGQHSDATPASVADGEFGAPAGLVVGDATHRQVALRWDAVGKAAGYNVYRSTAAGGPYGPGQRVNARAVTTTTFVDYKVGPSMRYFYIVRAVGPADAESTDSGEVDVVTAKTPPPCDPYFSLRQERAVTKNNKPNSATCP